MTQVADRVALPIRVHDTLLALAGRLDDDALTEARALLASAELDRAVELVAGCLVAGSIPVSVQERNALTGLVTAANCDAELLDGLVVGSGTVRHRFTDGRSAQQPADAGVAVALEPVLDALPDIASVWSVWRTTPAGASPGPVPQRVVLVEVGAAGVAPATAYRMEHALRRAGIPASVEVLRDGVPRESYHADALLHAVKLEIAGVSSSSSYDSEPSWRSDPEPVVESESFSYLPDPEPEPEPLRDEPYQPPSWQAEPSSPAPLNAQSSQPSMRPVPVPDNPGQDDSALNDQERDLLRQLHEELAKREQTSSDPTPPRGTPWPSAQHTGPHRSLDWPSAPATGAQMINGVPPSGDHPPFPA